MGLHRHEALPQFGKPAVDPLKLGRDLLRALVVPGIKCGGSILLQFLLLKLESIDALLDAGISSGTGTSSFAASVFDVLRARLPACHAGRPNITPILVKVTFISEEAPVIDEDDPLRHLLQKIAVMGHDQHRAFKVGKCVLDGLPGRNIQMVGRFIQDQEVGLDSRSARQRCQG